MIIAMAVLFMKRKSEGKEDEYGKRYSVDVEFTGANGRKGVIKTSWIVKDGVTRMTSAYVKDEKKWRVVKNET